MKLLSVLGLVTAILFLFSPMVTAQSLSISGKVIDKNSQEPVIGASVLIEGTSNGTITIWMVILCFPMFHPKEI